MFSKGILGILTYEVVFFCVLIVVILRDRKKQKRRRPFPEDLRLIRMPGESLWKRVIEHDDSDFIWWIAVMFIPLLIGRETLSLVFRFFQLSESVGLVLTIIVFVLAILVCVKWVADRLQQRNNYYLGFFGERYVAESLEPLKGEGWFIFHDIHCKGATGDFNLDHVAVGPGGVWVVETKTRRKRDARPGLKEHEVIFDGDKIIWPWRNDTDSLKQACNNARWLGDWLKTATGKTIDVAAVLAIPGYFVIEQKLGAVRVVNPKVLIHVLKGRKQSITAKEEIDLIRRQLELKCRDVEY